MRIWGFPEELIEVELGAAEQDSDEPLGIWPENEAPVRLFLMSATQWRLGPMGFPTGLDYPAVEAAARLGAIGVTPEIFEDLRVMEAEALDAMGERWERERERS